MRLNRTSSSWTELERDKLNENWRIIEGLGGKVDNIVDEISDEAFDKIVDSAKLDWKNPVDSFEDLPSSASEGETRMVRDTGKVYRFNGTVWQEIQQIDVSPVNEVDSRLTTQLADEVSQRKKSISALDTKKANELDVFLKQNGININDFDEATRQVFLEAQGIDVNYVLGRNGVKRENYANRSISPEKTTFARNKNLAGDLIEGILISGGPGDSRFREAEGAYSYVTKLEPGKYTVAKSESNRFRVAFSLGYPRPEEPVAWMLPNIDDETSKTFEIEEVDHYVTVYVTNSEGSPPYRFQIEKGDRVTEYAKLMREVEIDFLERSIPVRSLRSEEGKGIVAFTEEKASDLKRFQNQLNSISTPRNLFKGLRENISISGSFVENTGVFREREYAISYVIKLEKGKTYTVSKSESNRFRIATSVGYPVVDEDVERYLFYDDEEDVHTFTLAGDEDHVTIYLTNDGFVPENFQIEEGLGNTPFGSASINFDSIVDDRVFIADKPGGDYYPSSGFLSPERDIDIIYGIYDSLVDEYPNYVSKTFLADDESGLPIYRYDFKPLTLEKEVSIPKIIYTVTHGHERYATYGGALFFREMCEKWKDSNILKLMRWNVHFIVVPNLNPWGFNNNSRTNFNGVDLARNFSEGWVYNDSDSDRFSGYNPLSEIGTQTMNQLLQENRDAFFAIDHHNFRGDPWQGNLMLWTGTVNQQVQKMQGSYINNMVAMSKKLMEFDRGVSVLGSFRHELAPGSLGRQFEHYGIRGLILECPNTFNYDLLSHEAQISNMGFLGNVILTAIRYFSR